MDGTAFARSRQITEGRPPGVYADWLPRPRLQGLPRADIAGFAGMAARGPLLLPMRIESWRDFVDSFGPPLDEAHLGYAVRGFFANGGRTCWIVRARPGAGPRCAATPIFFDAREPGTAFRLVATSVGKWGNELKVVLANEGGTTRQMVELRDRQLVHRRAQSLNDLASVAPRRLSEARTTVPVVLLKDDAAFEPGDLDLPIASELRHRRDERSFGSSHRLVFHLEGGHDSPNEVGPGDLEDAINLLAEIDEIGVLAVPDIMLPNSEPRLRQRCRQLGIEPFVSDENHFSVEEIDHLQQVLVSQCERLRDRVVLLDPQNSRTSPLDLIGQPRPESPFAAFYYPWLMVPQSEASGVPRALPPSGCIAGLIAQRDLERGVHASPANVALQQVVDVVEPITPELHGHLNDVGLNVIVATRGRGIRPMGARTLSPDQQWRYLNVRRVVSLIITTLHRDCQWTVFEPHSPVLWRGIERTARNLLFSMWQAGALAGESQAQAFSVQCNAITNPQSQRQQGRVWCHIGIQPVPPAEYLLLRIGLGAGEPEFELAARSTDA